MKKHLLAVGAVTALGLTGLVGTAAVNATSDTATGSDPMSSLVSAIATKFNLNQSDVQTVFDEQRTKMDAERESEITTTLAQLVTDGKLTQAQSDAITAKRAEIKAEMDTNRTNGTRPTQDEMEAKRTALDTWASEQGIDTQYLRYVMGGGPRGGHGGPDMGPRDSSDTSSQSSSSTSTTE